MRAARCNQWIVRGEKLDAQALDQAVKENFRCIADAIYDLYHTSENPSAVLRLLEPNPTAVQFVQRPKFTDRGLIVAGIHMSNFDMVYQMGGLAGLQALALTLPELSAGYKKQLEMRLKKGAEVLPATLGNLKYAIDYLKRGGLVFTAIDRPDENITYRPKFFGRPAPMPNHHIFLALKASVPIMIAATIKMPDGKYHFLFSDPIEMQNHPDRHNEILLNTENVLRIVEDFIRHYPSQWAMTYPVWPDAMGLV